MILLDLIFPKNCVGCGKNGNYLCQDCLSHVPLAKPTCPVCEKPSIDGVTHFRCNRTQSLDGRFSVWKYGGIIKKAITLMKYKHVSEIAKELALAAVFQLRSNKLLLDGSPILHPIPMHWYKENFRGFNQADEIGYLISREVEWEVRTDLVVKNKKTRQQAGLGKHERRLNVRGVFSAGEDLNKFDLNNPVILFDDVYTTGSTMKEVCRVLKRNGVKTVWGLTLAS